MKLNLKIFHTLILLAIVIICLIIYRKHISNFNNPIYQTLSSNEKDVILNQYLDFNDLSRVLVNDVVIKKLKNSSQLVIQNLTDTQKLLDFHYLKNFGIKNSQLEYQLRDLENTNSIMSGLLVTHGQSTSPKNSKYGFILRFSKDNFKTRNNIGEFCVDFTNSRQEQLNNLHKIDAVVKSPLYQKQTRKTVNLFTQYTGPADIQPYFTKGTHGKDIKTVVRFLDATNIDYLRNFPEGRYNILDNNLNPILTYCKLDIPYCGVNLKPQGNIKGRDKYVSGKFNHGVGEYTIVDSKEYTNYKSNRRQIQEEDKKKAAEVEIENIKSQKPTYDILTFNQRNMIRKYDNRYYQDLVDVKKRELLSRKDQDFGDLDIRFISENNLQGEFNMFVGGFTQELTQLTEKKYRNMEEHFTDSASFSGEVNNLGFSGEKYQQYQNYETCMTKENRDINTAKLTSKLYSPILQDNLMIQKDKKKFDKIRSKMDFKCRKHYKERDTRYFYGGIDFDGQTKCYGEANACKIFSKKQDCLNLEKNLTSEGFTGDMNSDVTEYFWGGMGGRLARIREDPRDTLSGSVKEEKLFPPGFNPVNSILTKSMESKYPEFKFEKDTIYNFKLGGIRLNVKELRYIEDSRGRDYDTRGRLCFTLEQNGTAEQIGIGSEKIPVDGATGEVRNTIFFFYQNKKYYLVITHLSYKHFSTMGLGSQYQLIILVPDKPNYSNIHIGYNKNINNKIEIFYQLLTKVFLNTSDRRIQLFPVVVPNANSVVTDLSVNDSLTKQYRDFFGIQSSSTPSIPSTLSTAATSQSAVPIFDPTVSGPESPIKDTTDPCHNYYAFKHLNKDTTNEIQQKIRLNKNFEISFDFNYTSQYPVKPLWILKLLVPEKYWSSLKKANSGLEFNHIFVISTSATESNHISIRFRTPETSLLIPEGTTEVDKHKILEEKQKKTTHNLTNGGVEGKPELNLGYGDIELQPGKKYNIKIQYFKDLIKIYLNGEMIASKPSLEKLRKIYDDINLYTFKKQTFFNLDNFKYTNLDDINSFIRCAADEAVESTTASITSTGDKKAQELQSQKDAISKSMSESTKSFDDKVNKSKTDVTEISRKAQQEVINLKVQEQQRQIIQNKQRLQIENEKKYNETVEKMRKRELASDIQKNLSDKIAGLNKLVEYDPYDSSQAGYIGAELEEDYQKYNFINCIPYEREDITCKHVTKNMKFDMETKALKTENQTLVDIITLDTAQEFNIPEILQSHEVLEFNSNQKKFLQNVKELNENELETYIDFEMNRPIDYLIEPCYEEYKIINSNIIFEGFQVKFRMVNIVDSKNSIPGFTESHYTTIQIIKNNTPDSYILDNTGNPVKIEAEDFIYLYLDNSGNSNEMPKLHLEVYYKNSILKNSKTLNIFNLKGKYGESISLFLQTNNQHIFDEILFAEQLGNIVLPYDPFLNVKVE